MPVPAPPRYRYRSQCRQSSGRVPVPVALPSWLHSLIGFMPLHHAARHSPASSPAHIAGAVHVSHVYHRAACCTASTHDARAHVPTGAQAGDHGSRDQASGLSRIYSKIKRHVVGNGMHTSCDADDGRSCVAWTAVQVHTWSTGPHLRSCSCFSRRAAVAKIGLRADLGPGAEGHRISCSGGAA